MESPRTPKDFRVFDTEENRYCEGNEFAMLQTSPNWGLTRTIGKPLNEVKTSQDLDVEKVDWADADLLTDRYIAEQWTGKVDEKGTKIYEGDILDLTDWFGEKTYKVVRYDAVACGFSPFWEYLAGVLKVEDCSFFNVKVVGNIHHDKEKYEGKII